MKNFAGINFCGQRILKNFAELTFAEKAKPRKFLAAKVSDLKVVACIFSFVIKTFIIEHNTLNDFYPHMPRTFSNTWKTLHANISTPIKKKYFLKHDHNKGTRNQRSGVPNASLRGRQTFLYSELKLITITRHQGYPCNHPLGIRKVKKFTVFKITRYEII